MVKNLFNRKYIKIDEAERMAIIEKSSKQVSRGVFYSTIIIITSFLPVFKWLESHANPALNTYRVRVDLAWFQATALGYCQFGLVLHAVGEAVTAELQDGSTIKTDQHSV